jgi:hypothetical protein
LPFSGQSHGDLLIKQATEKPVPPIRRKPDLSRAANDLVLWMMEKDRDRRPDSPGVVVKRIDKILKRHGEARKKSAPAPKPVSYRRLFTVLEALRKNLGRVNETWAMDLIEQAVEAGATIESLLGWARAARNWIEWRTQIQLFISRNRSDQ